ncbi:MAG: hypothetical protein VX589_00480, partial [Myxococcota bacterium]|nr:hypothetical protein [Myxococcota bacterium]
PWQYAGGDAMPPEPAGRPAVGGAWAPAGGDPDWWDEWWPAAGGAAEGDDEWQPVAGEVW